MAIATLAIATLAIATVSLGGTISLCTSGWALGDENVIGIRSFKNWTFPKFEALKYKFSKKKIVISGECRALRNWKIVKWESLREWPGGREKGVLRVARTPTCRYSIFRWVPPPPPRVHKPDFPQFTVCFYIQMGKISLQISTFPWKVSFQNSYIFSPTGLKTSCKLAFKQVHYVSKII